VDGRVVKPHDLGNVYGPSGGTNGLSNHARVAFIHGSREADTRVLGTMATRFSDLFRVPVFVTPVVRCTFHAAGRDDTESPPMARMAEGIPYTSLRKSFRTKVLDNCAPYTHGLLEAYPQLDLVVVSGAEAGEALGVASTNITDVAGSAVQVKLANGRLVWVVVVPATHILALYPVYMERMLTRLRDVYNRLRDRPPTPPSWTYDERVHVRVVHTAEQAQEMAADLRLGGWVAWDVETFGRAWNREFRVLTISFATVGKSYAYTVMPEALDDPQVIDVIRRLLEDEAVPKVGQNVIYDENAVFARWGIDSRGLVHDTLLTRRILDAGLKGDLATLGVTVGIAGHKEEVTTEADAAYVAYRKREIVPESVEGDEDAEEFIADSVEHDGKRGSKAWSFAGVTPEVLARYNARDSYVTGLVAIAHDKRLRSEGLAHVWEFTKDAHYAVRSLQRNGMPIDQGKLAEARDMMLALRMRALLLAKSVDPDVTDKMISSPKQLGQLLYGKMGLPVRETTAKGKPSTSEAALRSMASTSGLVQAILEYRSCVKADSTYLLAIQRATRDDGRIHPSFHIGTARSGRMSVSDPPIHQIPRAGDEVGRIVRSVFVALPGYKLVSVDLSQVELRVAAYLSEDAVMARMFREDADLHMEAARIVAPLAWGIDPDKVTKEHRSITKRFVFGLLYGMSTMRLAKETNQTEADAERVRNAILGQFVDLARWCDEQIALVARTHTVWSTWKGERFRRRFLPEASSPSFKHKKHADNVAVNGPVQSLASDICLDALCRVVRYTEQELPRGTAEVVMTIHDSIVLHVREDAVAEVAARVQREMCAREDMLGLPLKADVEVGDSWDHMEAVK
jgi:DNA polymerase-1